MVDLVLEAEALADEKLERENVLGLGVDLGRERVDRDGVVLRLGREKDTGEPAPRRLSAPVATTASEKQILT